jgi:Holliday junction resolvase RusA-like endonuclease
MIIRYNLFAGIGGFSLALDLALKELGIKEEVKKKKYEKITMEIVILGRVPSKKNQRKIVSHGGRSFIVPSSAYEKWEREASKQLEPHLFGRKIPLFAIVYRISIIFDPPDRIKGDLTNKAESVMDLLVKNRVIKDDNWFEVPQVVLRLGSVGRERAGVTVVIEGQENE